MMISKFENLNLSGTRMVGIKMLLEFWMKTKEIEENQKSALKANQRSMLEDLNTVDDSTNSNESLAGVEPAKTVVLTTGSEETKETMARFKFDNGKIKRIFDCARVLSRNLG